MKFSNKETIIQNINQIEGQHWLAIMKLRSESFVSEQKCVYTDPDEFDIVASHVSVLSENELIAYARVFKSNRWNIGRVAVGKDYRGNGLGVEIMNTSFNHIASIDPKSEIELSAQLYLSKFYQSLGFVIHDSMYLEDGIPHLKMVYAP